MKGVLPEVRNITPLLSLVALRAINLQIQSSALSSSARRPMFFETGACRVGLKILRSTVDRRVKSVQ